MRKVECGRERDSGYMSVLCVCTVLVHCLWALSVRFFFVGGFVAGSQVSSTLEDLCHTFVRNIKYKKLSMVVKIHLPITPKVALKL